MKPLNSLFYPSTLSFLLLFIALPGIQTVAAGSAGTGNALANYKLQPMDLLKVQVFQELDMDREVRVSKDFIVVLPLIESVDLKNRTVREAELLITDLYKKDYLVNPQINVTVMEYAQRTLTVLGAVNSPGTVVIPPEKDLTLIEAIARAGGFRA
jgi:polysaccharide export outer membrane protein